MQPEINGDVERVVAELKSAGAREIYLFGSTARGRVSVSSDLDLAISGLPAQNFFHAAARAGEVSDRTVDLVDLDQETPFTRYLKDENELIRVG